MSTKVISADSHIMEPPGLWAERMDQAFRDRAPRVVNEWKDKKGEFDDFDGVGGDNLGLKKRSLPFQGSKEVQLIGRPHCDIFNQPRVIANQLTIKVRLTPSTSAFVLVTSTADQFVLKIVDAKLHVCSLEIIEALQVAIEQRLAHQNITMPLQTVGIKTVCIPRGQQVAEFDNLYLNQVPERVIFVLVPDASLVGGFAKNPFYFQHFDLNFAALYLNGECIPRKGYQPDFPNKNYGELFLGLLRAFGLAESSESLDIEYNEFAEYNGFCIIAFDLTSNNTAGFGTVAHPGGGNLRLELRFTRATPETLKVLCFAENSAELSIDRYRNIVLTNL